MARACFLRNVHCGGEIVSGLELVRRYTPALALLPQSPVLEQVKQAHHAQTARRAIRPLLKNQLE